jgi:hypothetical protein
MLSQRSVEGRRRVRMAMAVLALGAAAIGRSPVHASMQAVTDLALPPPWTYQDIGPVGPAGSASHASTIESDDIFTVKSAGADIWGTSDAFGYVYQPFAGDGWIAVNVESVQNTDAFAKAGLMLRESLDPGSAHVLLDLRPHGETEFLTRPAAGAETSFIASSTESFPTALVLYRNGSVVSGYVIGINTVTPVGSTTISMGRNLFAGLAVTSHDASTLNTSTFGPPFAHNYAFGLPDRWIDADVGAVGQMGGTSYDAGTFTVRGGGADIWGTSDSFHYLSQTLPAGQLVVRVTSVEATDPFAKAGVMMRLNSGSLGANANVVLDVRPTGDVEFMTRSTAGAETMFLAGTALPLPVWLKMVASGTTITGSVSADGTNWTEIGSTQPDFAQMYAGDGHLEAGLAVTSHDPSRLNTSTFDNVALTDAPDFTALPHPWRHGDVGDTGQAGTASYDAGVFTVRGAGADIWGTADAFQMAYQQFFSNAPYPFFQYSIEHIEVAARVTAVGDTDMFAKAGVMIRDSSDANAAHAILDVRPTGDIELMTRASTGASTTFAAGSMHTLPVWLKLVRSGAAVTGYVSSDGASWDVVGSADTSLSRDHALAGPVVTSHNPAVLNTATFDHVGARMPQ